MCVCVCMYVCMYVFMYACVSIYIKNINYIIVVNNSSQMTCSLLNVRYEMPITIVVVSKILRSKDITLPMHAT